MTGKIAKKVGLMLTLGLAPWGMSNCSKEKESASVSEPVTAEASAPAVSMKEPDQVAVATPAPAPVTESAPATATPPAKAGAVKVRARFDGYAARVAKGLWQPVRLATEVANFGLITPMEAIPSGSGLVVEGGPEGIAVGTPAGTLQTTDGRSLVAGREYAFAFTKGAGEVWAVEITAVP